MPFSPSQYTELLASTREKLVTKDLVDQVFMERPSLDLFRQVAKSYGGESVQVNIVTGEANNTGWTDNAGTFQTGYNSEIVKRAIYEWAQPHISSIHLQYTDLEKNATPERIFDLVTAHFNAAKNKIGKDMAKALHSKTKVAGSNMETFHTIVGTADLAGIPVAANPSWKSTVEVLDSDTVSILDAFRQVTNGIAMIGGAKPTDVLCGISVYEAYEKALEDKGRIIYTGDNGKIDGRYRELAYDGLRVVLDPDCLADTAFFLHRPTLVAGYLNDNFIKVATEQQLVGTMETVTPIVSIPVFGTTERRNNGKLVWNKGGVA